MQSRRQVRIVVERTKLNGRERRLGGKAPQWSPAIWTEGALGVLAAVALAEVDPGLALRDFESGLRRKGDIVRPAARSLLTVGAVANADTHQWCSDLESDRATSASSRTVRHGHLIPVSHKPQSLPHPSTARTRHHKGALLPASCQHGDVRLGCAFRSLAEVRLRSRQVR